MPDVVLEKVPLREEDTNIFLRGQLRAPLREDECVFIGEHGIRTSVVDRFEVQPDGRVVICTKNSRYWFDHLEEEFLTRQMVLKYLRFDYLDFDDVMPDGFYDAGHGAHFKTEHTGGELSVVPDGSGREIMMVDAGTDIGLIEKLRRAERILEGVSDEVSRVKLLAMFVAGAYGGVQLSRGGDRILGLCERDMGLRKNDEGKLKVGQLNFGACRHRAIVFKYLADRLGIRSRLIRGRYGPDGHAWNIVDIGGKYYVVDVSRSPGELKEVDSIEVDFYRREMGGRIAGAGGHSLDE